MDVNTVHVIARRAVHAIAGCFAAVHATYYRQSHKLKTYVEQNHTATNKP